MPKVKTNSGAKKRFRLTGSGKIKRHHAFKNHILTKKEFLKILGLKEIFFLFYLTNTLCIFIS